MLLFRVEVSGSSQNTKDRMGLNRLGFERLSHADKHQYAAAASNNDANPDIVGAHYQSVACIVPLTQKGA